MVDIREEISITCVVPVCNSENYLEMSITSLCKQTLENVEIICVDDASQDQSLEILEKIAFSDSRVCIIKNEKTEGAAISRNKGLRAAKGKYIIFLDSDDYFYPNMLQESYELAVKHEADLVIFSYEQVKIEIEEEKEVEGQITPMQTEFRIYVNPIKDRDYLEKITGAPWNKLVRRDFLMKHGIEFQDIPSANDMFYARVTGILAEKVVMTDQILMKYYFGRKGSITRFRQRECFHFPMAWQHLVIYLKKVGEIDKCKDLYNVIIDMLLPIFSSNINTKECNKATTELFYQCEELIECLVLAGQQGMVSFHGTEFLKRVQNREKLWEIHYVEYFLPGIKQLVEECQNSHKKMAIWGCGKIGKEVLEEMELNNIKVDYVIDSDEKKIGSRVGEYEISRYADISEQIDVILITAKKIGNEVKSVAVGKKVIDLLAV